MFKYVPTNRNNVLVVARYVWAELLAVEDAKFKGDHVVFAILDMKIFDAFKESFEGGKHPVIAKQCLFCVYVRSLVFCLQRLI